MLPEPPGQNHLLLQLRPRIKAITPIIIVLECGTDSNFKRDLMNYCSDRDCKEHFFSHLHFFSYFLQLFFQI